MAEANGTRACVVCGNAFQRYRTKAVCSDACAAIRQRTYQATSDARKAKPTRQCAVCKRDFTPSRMAGYKYCCREHAELSKRTRDNARKRDPDKSRAWQQKRRERYTCEDRARNAERRREYRRLHGRKNRALEYERRRVRKGIKTKADAAISLCGAMAAMHGRREYRVRLLVARSDAHPKQQPRQLTGCSIGTLALKSDPERYARELTRWRRKKLAKSTGLVMLEDGTATASVLLGGSHCLYCNCALTEKNRTHDHMRPLSRGGVHGAVNIAPCCRDCNNKKGSIDFDQWIATLHPKDSRRAVAYFEKRNGPMIQAGLPLAMAA